MALENIGLTLPMNVPSPASRPRPPLDVDWTVVRVRSAWIHARSWGTLLRLFAKTVPFKEGCCFLHERQVLRIETKCQCCYDCMSMNTKDAEHVLHMWLTPATLETCPLIPLAHLLIRLLEGGSVLFSLFLYAVR